MARMFWTKVRRVGVGVFLGLVGVSGLQSCSTGGGDDGNDGTSGADGSDGSGATQSGSGAAPSSSGGASSGDGGTIGSGTGGTLLGQGGMGGDVETECNDGVDNDDDGHVDYAYDPGCYGPGDGTESAGTRAEENGFTTFEFGDDSVVVYVSAEGDDAEDGATPDTAVRTITRADELVRDGEHDFMLLRRGDRWRDETLGRFKSGRDAAHPIVIASYGESLELPRIETTENFIHHNGQARSFVALMDLHFFNYAMDPSDPDFDGATATEVRYVGGGSDLLIEGCHFEYVELIVQSYGDAAPYSNVEVRASVLEKTYHVDTCVPGNPNGNSDYIATGIYSSHVEGLVIEGNIFDHNGWNEDVESACATIYNHNAYLNANDLVVRDNVFARASSIHVKLRSDVPGDMTGTRVTGNYFVEGEFGVSAGGNTEEQFRFVDTEITNNVFSDIGRTTPTTRGLAWAVELVDQDGVLVQGNHFLNHWATDATNSFGVSIADGTARDVSILDNLFYRIQNRALAANVSAGHEGIEVAGNSFIDPDQDARLVDQNGPFDDYSYADNRYYGSASAQDWFGTDDGDVDVAGWVSASGETGAETLSAAPDFADPERTIETYAESLQIGDSLEDYIAQARLQTRLRYYYELSAPAINGYIRAGFEE